MRKSRINYLSALVVLAVLFSFSPLKPQETASDETSTTGVIDFKDQTSLQLDLEGHPFFRDMARREYVLLSLYRNLRTELDKRGPAALHRPGTPFQAIYDIPVEQAQSERQQGQALSRIARGIASVRALVEQGPQVVDLSDALRRLETRIYVFLKRQPEPSFTNMDLATSAVLAKYDAEVKALIASYEKLHSIERDNSEYGNNEIASRLREQRQALDVLLDEPVLNSPVPANAQKPLHDIVATVEDLGKTVSAPGTQRQQAALLQKLESQVASVIGPVATSKNADVFSLFGEWRAQTYAEYQAAFVRQRIIKKYLLTSGSEKERERMLQADLSDAVGSFNVRQFDLAADLFTRILHDYSPVYQDLTSVRFLRAECFYQQNLLDRARNDYAKLLSEQPSSAHGGDALLRVLQIAVKQQDWHAFDQAYSRINRAGQFVSAETEGKCRYLAGVAYLQNSRYVEAERALAAVTKSSPYSRQARFLLGLAKLGMNDTASGTAILQEFAGRKQFFRFSSEIAYLRSQALLKLGYLHYNRGEHDKALALFLGIPADFELHDKVMLGSAWANFRLGRHEQALALADFLTERYPYSENLYEARVLAGHCRSLLGEEDPALERLRYVTNARAVLMQSAQISEERRRLLKTLNESESLEQQAVRANNREVYEAAAIRSQKLYGLLADLRYRGSARGTLVADFARERNAILDQLDELDEIAASAEAAENEKLLNEIDSQRHRLARALEVYQSDLALSDKSFFVDYPLTTSEAVSSYRAQTHNRVLRELADEQAKLSANVRQIQSLLANSRDSRKAELGLVQRDFAQLGVNAELLRNRMLQHPVVKENTDYAFWASVSGLAVSDIVFNRMRQRDTAVADLARNVRAVDAIIEKRRDVLEQRLLEYDAVIAQIEREIESDASVRAEKQKEEYFKDSYFDKSEKEEKVSND